MKRNEPFRLTVKKLMIDKGIKQIEVAKHFECTEAYVSQALHGKHVNFLKKIAAYVDGYKIRRAA